MTETPLDADRLALAIAKAGEAWADAEAAAQLLEETKKSMLAKAMSDSTAASIAAKEMMALASEEYVDFVNGMVKARQAANKARVRYDSSKILAELRRSQESTRRAEAQIR